MENDDIPMPHPTDRLSALLTEALLRSGRMERTEDRLAGLLEATQATLRLYAVLLTASSVSNKVRCMLKRSCGCTAVVAVNDRAWIVEAPGGLQDDLRDKIDTALKSRYSVFVLELGVRCSWAYMPEDERVSDLLSKYLLKEG